LGWRKWHDAENQSEVKMEFVKAMSSAVFSHIPPQIPGGQDLGLFQPRWSSSGIDSRLQKSSLWKVCLNSICCYWRGMKGLLDKRAFSSAGKNYRRPASGGATHSSSVARLVQGHYFSLDTVIASD
jgi:hypothetical protein